MFAWPLGDEGGMIAQPDPTDRPSRGETGNGKGRIRIGPNGQDRHGLSSRGGVRAS